MEPTFVPMASVPEADLLELLHASLGASPHRTVDFWRWKHTANPFGSSSGQVALDSGGNPVALRAFLRWELAAPGRILRAVRAVDTATHPDWQRRGLFRRLTTRMLDELATEGVDLVFNTPNPKSMRGYLSMGWREVGRVALRLAPRRPWRLVLSRLGGGTDDSLDADDLTAPATLLGEPRIMQMLATNPAADRLCTMRSEAYLRWRYVATPAFRYGGLAAIERDGAAVALFRLRRRRGARELSVAELATDGSPRGTALAAGLLRRAAQRTDADYTVAAARTVLSGGPRVLPIPVRGPTLVVRELGSGPLPVDVADATKWDMSVGDLELF